MFLSKRVKLDQDSLIAWELWSLLMLYPAPTRDALPGLSPLYHSLSVRGAQTKKQPESWAAQREPLPGAERLAQPEPPWSVGETLCSCRKSASQGR